MRVNVDFEITRMELDGFEIPIPEGFSEMLNRAGVWEIPDDKVDKENPLENYKRRVVREEGSVKTYLTYTGRNKKEGNQK